MGWRQETGGLVQWLALCLLLVIDMPQLACSPPPHLLTTAVQLRLADGPDSKSGRLEVFYDNVWGMVGADGPGLLQCRLHSLSLHSAALDHVAPPAHRNRPTACCL